MAGGNGSCVGGWIPTTAAEATSLGGFDVNDVEKQFGTIFTPGRKFYSWYKCNGIVPCNGTDGFDGNFSNITQKVHPYAAGNPIGFGNLLNHRIGRIIRKPHQLTPTNLQADVAHNGLYLDLTGWKTSNTVNVKFTRWENNSGHFLDIRLYGPQNASGGSTPFTGGYNIRGNSDIHNNNLGGTLWATFSENQSSATYNLKGGLYYMFRGLSLIYLPFSNLDFYSLTIWAVFFGLDFIATVPPTVKLASKYFGTIQGPVIFGWIFSAHQFGAAFAAYGAGLARDSLLTYLPVFIWAGIACFVATVLIFIFKKINISFAA